MVNYKKIKQIRKDANGGIILAQNKTNNQLVYINIIDLIYA
jgi:hypothetical protein